jgi:hypothetical protein
MQCRNGVIQVALYAVPLTFGSTGTQKGHFRCIRQRPVWSAAGIPKDGQDKEPRERLPRADTATSHRC